MDETYTERGNLSETANWLAIVVIALLLLGAVMVYSASAGPEVQPDWQEFWKYASLRQLVFVPIAVLVMFFASYWPVRWWNIGRCGISLTTVLLALSVATLVLVLVPGIGIEVNRARRWLRIGVGGYGLGFQPSELAKIALVIFLAAFYARPTAKARSFWQGFLPGAAVVFVMAGLIATQDFGTGALLALVGVLMMAAGGVNWLWLMSLAAPAAAGFYRLVYLVPKRWERFTCFLNPDPTGPGYQAWQSKIAIGSGGWRGLGLGKGVQKYEYLPEDTTDFIFAIIAEELGLVGCALVIIAFIILLLLAARIVSRASSTLGKLMAFGLAMTIGLQAAIHIGVDLVVLPTKGISLPFVSAGGTGLVLMALSAGLIMSVGKSKWEPMEERSNIIIQKGYSSG